MRGQTFEIVVTQSTAAVDLRLLTRVLAASAVRQHLASAPPVDIACDSSRADLRAPVRGAP